MPSWTRRDLTRDPTWTSVSRGTFSPLAGFDEFWRGMVVIDSRQHGEVADNTDKLCIHKLLSECASLIIAACHPARAGIDEVHMLAGCTVNSLEVLKCWRFL
jgi:hypothetical protein